MTWRLSWLFVFLAVCLLMVAISAGFGCGDDDDDSDDGLVLDDGDDDDDDDQTQELPWRWRFDSDHRLIFYIGSRDVAALEYVDAFDFDPSYYMLFGIFKFSKGKVDTVALKFDLDDKKIYLTYEDQRVGQVFVSATETGSLRVSVTLDTGFEATALRLAFTMKDESAFWGFGEQYNYIDFNKKVVPIWVQEQGLDRAEDPLLPPKGSFTNSYFPMPYFMDPKHGYGFFLDNTEYSEFDLGASEEDLWQVEVWSRRADFTLLQGPTPREVVSQLTQEVGRPTAIPPDWAFEGVWLAAQNGTEAVTERVQTALDAEIPVTAVWVQDWVGERHFGLGNYGVKYRWIWDEDHYPNLPQTIADLDAQGVRFLGYFNPFVLPKYEHWADCVAGGYLIYRDDWQPYYFLISTFVGSLLDVTNPEAVEYFQGFAQQAADMGMKGWMADFGEWLPYDANIYRGVAPTAHNLYPTAWHRMNRQVLEEAYPDGDWVMFTRSGYTGEQRVAQVVWAGDQEATWSEEDGFPTVVRAGLSLGLAGIPFFTHDIAGFSGGPSTKELFMRWAEMGAFTPVMRTHDGLKKGENHRFDSDQETLEHFKLMAEYHKALLPYWKQLAEQAQTEGLPIIRHTALVDPDWKQSYVAHAQWMLGDDMVFVPVTAPETEEVNVYFPEGRWEHALTGREYDGHNIESVSAPIGTPAIFVRKGQLADVVSELRKLAK